MLHTQYFVQPITPIVERHIVESYIDITIDLPHTRLFTETSPLFSDLVITTQLDYNEQPETLEILGINYATQVPETPYTHNRLNYALILFWLSFMLSYASVLYAGLIYPYFS